ncbi:MAG: tyrosine-type recombinase/integrase [Chloroflexales bacterium]
MPRPDDDEVAPLTTVQVDALLSLVDAYEWDKTTGVYRPHRLAALFHTAIKAGPRQGELIGLRWQDLDLDRRELRIAGQYQRGERVAGKSKKAHRAIPISAGLVQILRNHRRNQIEERAIGGPEWNKAELVFCSENGTALGASGTWRTFMALQRRAGL